MKPEDYYAEIARRDREAKSFYHRARNMSVGLRVEFEWRLEEICKQDAFADQINTHKRIYAAMVPVDGLPSYSVAEQVAKDIERLAGSEAGLESWTIY